MTELLNEIGPEKESPGAQGREGDKPTSVAVNTINLRKGVGVQCQVDNGLANARNKRGQTTLSIADKYPIWVDLDSANNDGAKHFKERKKFLQVARFGGPDTTDLITNNDTNEDTVIITSSPSVASTQEGNLEDGSDENQADSPKREFQEDQSTEQKEKELKERYRASYRDNYPIRERLGKISDNVGGITSLIDLRDNMQRMTQRLQVLETCANSIDEEFKVSQKVSL
ncbi:hypothetical protein PHMEG_00037725 [Phytophthora megakarya]|uniref:Uncharacterized protein n=1 Tax=Phytophthora megakarya TaxID=4795 RepID=A0A225UJ29_9STRA|nr:hypothetical protein PHMEG_00037725 [Phytophthora megakarya]